MCAPSASHCLVSFVLNFTVATKGNSIWQHCAEVLGPHLYRLRYSWSVSRSVSFSAIVGKVLPCCWWKHTERATSGQCVKELETLKFSVLKGMSPSGPSPRGSENPAERLEEAEEWRIERKQGLVNTAGPMRVWAPTDCGSSLWVCPGLDLGGILSLEKMFLPLSIAIGLLYLFIEGLDLVEFFPSLLVCWLVMSLGWSCSGNQIVDVLFTHF